MVANESEILTANRMIQTALTPRSASPHHTPERHGSLRHLRVRVRLRKFIAACEGYEGTPCSAGAFQFSCSGRMTSAGYICSNYTPNIRSTYSGVHIE